VKLALLILGVLLLGGLAVVADAYYQAVKIAAPIQNMRSDLMRIRNTLSRGEVPSDDAFRAATDDAARAQKRLRHTRFTFRLVNSAPFFNRPIRDTRLGVTAATESAAAAEDAREMIAKMLGPDALTQGDGSSPEPAPIFHDGMMDLTILDQVIAHLESLIGHLEAANRAAGAIEPIPFFNRVMEARDEAVDESIQALALARNGLRAARLMPGFFGADRPKTYFLALQNNADQRATGGGVFAYSFVTIDNGRMSLRSIGRTRPLEGLEGFHGIPLPPAVGWYIRNVPHQYSRISSLGFTPDFPTDARSWAILLKKGVHRPIDGAIAIDPIAVAHLLGDRKLHVPIYPKPITSSNAVAVIEHDQYLLTYQEQVAFTDQIIGAAWPVISDPRPFTRTIERYGAAFQEKHIQMWLAEPDQQALVAELGWDGATRVPPAPGDYLYVVDNKLRGNKVDYYTSTKITYDVKIGPSDDATSTCRVRLTNRTPPGLPIWIVGRFARGVNDAALGLYVPLRASVRSLEPRAGYPTHVEGDARVFTRHLRVAPGRSAVASFTYSVPDAVRSTSQGRSYTLTIQHQPLVNPADLTVTVRLPEGATVRSAPGWSVKGNVATYTGKLTRDMTLQILF
jgi:hypothetical protein